MAIPRSIAAIASAIFPGIGQILQGRVVIGATQLVLAGVLFWWWERLGGIQLVTAPSQSPKWWFALLALGAVALWSIIDAAKQKRMTG